MRSHTLHLYYKSPYLAVCLFDRAVPLAEHDAIALLIAPCRRYTAKQRDCGSYIAD